MYKLMVVIVVNTFFTCFVNGSVFVFSRSVNRV